MRHNNGLSNPESLLMNYLEEEITELKRLNPDAFKLLDSEHIAYWIWNIENFDDCWYQDSFWLSLGYTDRQKFDVNTFWKSTLFPEDIEYSFKNLQTFLELQNSEDDFEQLLRYYHANGDIQWIKSKGKLLYNVKGKPIRMLGICQKKERIQYLQDYKNLLEQTVSSAKIGLWEVDLNTQIVFWSDITKEIHGVSQDYEGTMDEALQFYEDEPTQTFVTETFKKAINEGLKYDIQVKLKPKTGAIKWVRAIGIPVMKNNVCIRIYGLIQDIDKEVLYQKELEHKEALFRRTFEYASIGMALVGLKGEWLEVNNSLCNMLGYSKEELTAITFQDITHPADLDSDLNLLHEVLDGKRNSYQLEKRYFHKNGEIVWALLAVSVIKDKDKKPMHFVSQITDITKRKLALQKIESLLEITQNQNDRLLNFAHIVSHNLRSHTGNLTMLLDLMKIEMPESTNNEFYSMINQAVDNLSETITHLNEVILVHSKKKDDLIELNLNDFSKKALTNLNAQLIEHNVTVNNKIPKTLTVKFIPAYLDSTLLNLLSNAIKYRDYNRPLIIDLFIESNDVFDILHIKDNGLGIDVESNKERLFGMYKTFHNNPEARGIGLFITKNQVEALNGKIEVESEPGVQTTFKVYFKR